VKTKIMVTVCLIALLAATSGYGQQGVQGSLKAKIDFPFTVEGKVLPAGEYEFVRNELATAFRVSDGGKNGAVALVLTRLAGAMHTTPQDAHLVFDVVGDTHFLSEIWVPGEDGYLMLATKGKHEHKVIDVQR
jgi:hypothetical protein